MNLTEGGLPVTRFSVLPRGCPIHARPHIVGLKGPGFGGRETANLGSPVVPCSPTSPMILLVDRTFLSLSVSVGPVEFIIKSDNWKYTQIVDNHLGTMKRPRTLTAAFVKTVRRPGRYGDGRGGFGLSLLVKPTANGRLSKTWCQRVRIHGRITNIGLGSYPVVTLRQARLRALENRQTIEQGLDPRDGRIPTFEQAAEKVIAIHAAGWKPGGKSEVQWRSSLAAYAHPRLGRKPIDRITTGDVMECLVPIWHTRPETARRVRQRIGAVMRWAIAQGYRADNPAGDAVTAALPNNNVRRQHHRSLPHSEVAECDLHRPSIRRVPHNRSRLRVPSPHRSQVRRSSRRPMVRDRSRS